MVVKLLLKQQPQNSGPPLAELPLRHRITDDGLDRLRDACPDWDRQWLLLRYLEFMADKPAPSGGRRMEIVKEFREFAIKGNVIDLAVGLIIGAAFSRIVSTLVEHVIMPPIGYLLAGIDFSNLAITLPTPTGTGVLIRYGIFLNAVVKFLITAFAVFLLVKAINTIRRSGRSPRRPHRPRST